MKESYYKLYLKEIENIEKKKKILLHSCCAPCSSAVIMALMDYFDITILYYNPNISPKEEYLKRKEEQINLIKKLKNITDISIIDCDYDNEIYEKRIKGYEDCPERGKRCNICFNLRLEKTAEIGKSKNSSSCAHL